MVADPVSIYNELFEKYNVQKDQEDTNNIIEDKDKLIYPSVEGVEIHKIRQIIIKLVKDNNISIFNKLT